MSSIAEAGAAEFFPARRAHSIRASRFRRTAQARQPSSAPIAFRTTAVLAFAAQEFARAALEMFMLFAESEIHTLPYRDFGILRPRSAMNVFLDVRCSAADHEPQGEHPFIRPVAMIERVLGRRARSIE